MGRYNLHGRPHAVNGGRREEKLATYYAGWAQQVQTRYPATARLLRRLRDDFATQAERRRADRTDQFEP